MRQVTDVAYDVLLQQTDGSGSSPSERLRSAEHSIGLNKSGKLVKHYLRRCDAYRLGLTIAGVAGHSLIVWEYGDSVLVTIASSIAIIQALAPLLNYRKPRQGSDRASVVMLLAAVLTQYGLLATISHAFNYFEVWGTTLTGLVMTASWALNQYFCWMAFEKNQRAVSFESTLMPAYFVDQEFSWRHVRARVGRLVLAHMSCAVFVSFHLCWLLRFEPLNTSPVFVAAVGLSLNALVKYHIDAVSLKRSAANAIPLLMVLLPVQVWAIHVLHPMLTPAYRWLGIPLEHLPNFWIVGLAVVGFIISTAGEVHWFESANDRAVVEWAFFAYLPMVVLTAFLTSGFTVLDVGLGLSMFVLIVSNFVLVMSAWLVRRGALKSWADTLLWSWQVPLCSGIVGRPIRVVRTDSVLGSLFAPFPLQAHSE